MLSPVTLPRRLKPKLGAVRVFVSTSTLAGRALADERLAGLADGVFYAPLDFRFAVRRVLRALRPAVVVVAETEIWPHLYRESKRTGCGLLVVNGRISEDAWPRYRRWAWFFRHVLSLPDLILAQRAISRERYIALGAPPERVIDSGNLKYDFQPRGAAGKECGCQSGACAVVSTPHSGEGRCRGRKHPFLAHVCAIFTLSNRNRLYLSRQIKRLQARSGAGFANRCAGAMGGRGCQAPGRWGAVPAGGNPGNEVGFRRQRDRRRVCKCRRILPPRMSTGFQRQGNPAIRPRGNRWRDPSAFGANFRLADCAAK